MTFRWMLAFLFAVPAAQAAVTFPADLFGVRQLAEQIRAPFGLKLRDMGKALRKQARSANHVDFVDDGGKTVMTVQFLRTLNPEKTKRFEETRILSPDGLLIVSEATTTEGKDLEYSDPSRTAYLDGSPEYELTDRENLKLVIFKIGVNEAYRFTSSRSTDRLTTRTAVAYGGTPVLSVVDRTEKNGTDRMLEYSITGYNFRVGAFGSTYGGKSTGHTCRMYGLQSLLGAQLRLTCDGREITHYARFTELLSEFIVTPLYLDTLQPFISEIIKGQFPTVVRPPNLATNGKFYTDILDILNLLEPLRSTPSVLNVISRLRNYVALIQDGTIEIKDNR